MNLPSLGILATSSFRPAPEASRISVGNAFWYVIVAPALIVMAHAEYFRGLFENRRRFRHFQKVLAQTVDDLLALVQEFTSPLGRDSSVW